MFKRLFGRGKSDAEERAPTPAPTPPRNERRWDPPVTPDQSYFTLHLRGLSLDEAERVLVENYLLHGESGEPGMILARDGEWVSAFVPERIVRGVGFNRLASQIAREQESWVIGYRIHAGQGIDSHIFHGAEHVDQLAATNEGIEFEPEEAALFADLADVSPIVPRPPTQHPLDFHFALLRAMGLSMAALSWEEAVARLESGTLGEARLVRVP